MKTVKLSGELMNKIKSNKMSAIDIVMFILQNVQGSETKKPLRDTGIKDITVFGKPVTAANIDMLSGTMFVKF